MTLMNYISKIVTDNVKLYHHTHLTQETHTYIALPLIQLAGSEEVIHKGRVSSKKISIFFCKNLFQYISPQIYPWQSQMNS